MMESHDWTALKAEYASTDLSYSQLAEKHNVSKSSIARHGRQEDWAGARERFKQKVITKTVNKAANRAAGKLSNLIEATTKAAQKVNEILSDEQQFYRHLVVTETKDSSKVEEKRFKKADTKALKDVSSALKDLTATMRDLLELPTAQERHQRKIADARLKLEQDKADAARGVDDDEYGVVLMPPVEPLTPPADPEEPEERDDEE